MNRAPGHNDEYRRTLNRYRRSLDIALWFTVGLAVVFVVLGLLTLFTS